MIRHYGKPAGIGAHRLETVEACVAQGIKPYFWVKTFHHHNYWSARVAPDQKDIESIWCDDPQKTMEFMSRLEEPWIAFEAGTRVPMIVKWPGRVEEGSVSPALFSQVDMLASFASFTGQDYNAAQAKDSRDKLNVLIGEDKKGRDGLVQQAIQNVLTLVRNDGYKYISPLDGPEIVPWGTEIETGFSADEQLYEINSDPGENVNIASEFPEVVAKMQKLLDEVIQKY